jgi:GT2 family glycosyltransferase
MKVFGMVTTKDSWEYTSYAIKSFFRTTKFTGDEQLILIDNDESFEEDASWFSPFLEIWKNKEPLSFAANANQVMNYASERKADLYFLNNDIVFTDHWLNPLLIDEPSILSPLSNREIQYEGGGQRWGNVMKLNEYLGKQAILKEIAEKHRASLQGYRKVISLPFFAVKIPYSIYSAVGSFDEGFGKGGAEDNDYCIRTYQAGFDVKYAQQSYVLHFSGKSTWAGGETKEQTEERCNTFREAFKKKWGEKLLKLYIDLDQSIINESPELTELAKNEDYKSLIEKLAS